MICVDKLINKKKGSFRLSCVTLTSVPTHTARNILSFRVDLPIDSETILFRLCRGTCRGSIKYESQIGKSEFADRGSSAEAVHITILKKRAKLTFTTSISDMWLPVDLCVGRFLTPDARLRWIR